MSIQNPCILVGSTNKNKVEAVKEVIADAPILADCDVRGIAVESGVSEQPLTLEETIRGAKTRAENAFRHCHLSIGLEGGMMAVPETDGEYMIVSICSIFDGEKHHIGMSCGFRLPKEVARLMIEEGLDLNEAMFQCGLTSDPQLGASIGGVGFFTNGRINRKEFCKQSLTTALISIENSERFDGPSPQRNRRRYAKNVPHFVKHPL